MTELIRRASLAAVVVLLSLGVPGCTNSDPLYPQPGQIQVILNVSPPGAAGFDSCIVFLQQIGIRSVSTGADAIFGPTAIGALPARLGFNFADGAERQVGTVPLPVGRYQLSTLYLNYSQNPPLFLKQTPVLPTDPCNPSNCLDYVTYRMGTPVDPSDPDGARFNGKLPPSELIRDSDLSDPLYTIDDIPGSPTFELQEGTGARVTLVFDGAAIAQEFLNSFHCTCTGFCSVEGGPTTAAPCVSDFVKPTPAAFLSHVTIE